MAFIEGWPHLRGGLYEGFHCTYLRVMMRYDTFYCFDDIIVIISTAALAEILASS